MSGTPQRELAGEGARPAYRMSVVRYVIASVIAVIGIIAMTFYWNRADSIAQPPDKRPLQVKSDGYVSSQACQECHTRQHKTWHASYHRRMTQVASPESVIGRFDGSQARADNVTARFDRRGDEFWVRMDGLSGKDLEKRVVMTTGSHHMQMYWMSSGWQRELSLVPFVYLNEVQRWIPRRAAFLRAPGDPADDLETGRWNGGCIRCHTTHGAPGLGDMQVKSRAAEFGIACEACHGPGENHVAFHKGDRSAAIVDDIVNPLSLPHELKSQVCGQCHGIYRVHDVADYLSNGIPFRPGEDLRKIAEIGQYNEPETQFWNDGMARVSGREFNGLVDSPCFQGKEFSCFSCHTMHVPEDDPRELSEWANDQLHLDATIGNKACLQCHEKFQHQETLTAHTHHAAGSSGSQCYNCHMPHTTYGLLKAIRGHEISNPNVKVSIDTGRPNACNLCHLDKTLEWTADHLERWYDVTRPLLSDQQQRTSAALLDLLTGDAGGRALLAWHMGWKPAQEVSDASWIAPQLAQLLEDPYDAVRYIAQRSLRSLPGFEDFSYDFLAAKKDRAEAHREAVKLWTQMPRTTPEFYDAVLLDSEGNVRGDEMRQLLKTRSNIPVYLNE